jgi:hypothetical protein
MRTHARQVRKSMCDPASSEYFKCLGIRATGATLSPAHQVSRLANVAKTSKIVAAKLRAAKAREATEMAMRKLGLKDEAWGDGNDEESAIKTAERAVKREVQCSFPCSFLFKFVFLK